jgi:hypothetical protein
MIGAQYTIMIAEKLQSWLRRRMGGHRKRVLDHLAHEIPQEPFPLLFPSGPIWA